MFKKILHPLHPSHSFYAAIWGIILGIALAILFGLNFTTNAVYLIITSTIIVFGIKYISIFTLIIVFLAGTLIGNFCASSQSADQAILAHYHNEAIIISGDISEDPDNSQATTSLRLHHLKLHQDNSAPLPLSGALYVTLSSQTPLERSDTLLLEGKLSEGFGTFIGKMSRPKILKIERAEPGDIFARLKHWFADLVRQFIPSPEADLGLSYLVGMKSSLSADFSEALRAVGMTHVVVASGAHLAILVGAAKKLFGKISKFAGLLFSLFMIASFVLVVGFTPSMTRAALVAGLTLLFGYVGRKFAPARLIALVAAITLLINPINLLNLGWQLSFASFSGILILAPKFQRLFYGRKRPPWLASMLITSLATCLLCAPILIYNFGSISFLSFVANLIILPTLPYAMLGVMLTGVTSFLPVLATAIARITILILDLHIWLVEFLADKTMFIVELPSGDPRVFLLYIPLLLLTLIGKKGK